MATAIRTILYYPTINIPSNNWLRHALLYWDEVSSIVPQSWDKKQLYKVSTNIHYLIDEGQFRAIKPENLIRKADNWQAFEMFQEEFKTTVQSPAFKMYKERSNDALLKKLHKDKILQNWKYSRIHRNKTSDPLFDLLVDEGLINTAMYNDEWLMVERTTALVYMSLLAKYLAQIDKKQTVIGTDYGIYEKLNFKKVKEQDGLPIVSFNLFNILPTPKANVPLEKIIDFKRKRKDELLQFRKILMDFQSKVSKATSNQEIRELSANFQENIQLGIRNLSRATKDSRIETVFKSLKSLISIKSPSALLSGAAIANEKLNIIEAPIHLKILGLATVGLIELTGSYIEARNKEIAKIKESAFSYLLHARKASILKSSN